MENLGSSDMLKIIVTILVVVFWIGALVTGNFMLISGIGFLAFMGYLFLKDQKQ